MAGFTTRPEVPRWVTTSSAPKYHSVWSAWVMLTINTSSPESPSVGRRWSSLVTRAERHASHKGQQGNQQRTSPAADALEVRRTFVASRLSAVYLAAAYPQVVPRYRH